jgi:hypothetical protein
MPPLKNPGPLLVDKLRGYFDRLPEWLRGQLTIRIEHQKGIDAKLLDLDPTAIDSELKQTVTDERERTNKFIGDGAAGSGNDLSDLPLSHPSEVVIPETGQVADATETVSATESHLVEGPPLHAGTSEQVGDLWVTKKVETRATFDDKIFQLAREDLIPPEFRALVPEKLEAHTVNGTAALPALGAGETVRREEQKKVGIKTVSVQSRDMTTPPVITGQKVDPQWNGALLDLEQKIVPAGTVISQPFGTTDASKKPIDGTVSLQETWKLHTGAFPSICTRSYDSELQWEVQTYQTIVQQGSNYTPTTYDLDYEERPIDSVHSLRRVTNTFSLPAQFNTYATSMFTFPGLLTGLSFALVQLAVTTRHEPQWTAGVRASFSAPTTIRTQMDFFPPGPTAPALWGLYTWAQTDIVFKGISYSINLQNVLCDTWSLIGVTYAGDTYYGSTTDRFSISATTPSATNYTLAIGSEVAISSVADRYKRFWVRKTSFVTLR